MGINVQLLRTLEQDPDRSSVDLFLQVQPKGLGISDDLRWVLIQGDQQAPSFLFHRSFSQKLRG